ncbi:MAG: hypothetical protein H8E46_09490 [FCB group bacterium]|nr:hypothetical protein [FCB group bacterium]
MTKPQKNFARFLTGLFLLSGAVYIWGGLGINPDGVEYLINTLPFSELWAITGAYFYIFTAGLILCAGLIIASRVRLKSLNLSTGHVIGLVLFVLTLFPLSWLFAGLSGISVSLLIIAQNVFALAGLALLVASLSFWLENLKPPQIPSLKKRYPVRVFAAAIVYFLVVYFVSLKVLGGIPHVGDGVVQLWGAKMLAGGSFTVPAPPNIEFFSDPFLVVKNGTWFTQYPAGFQMMLVPFVLLGYPSLLNPLLAALTIILFVKICEELNLSGWWGLLFAMSPFVIFMSGSFMSHSAAMFWGALSLLAFNKSSRVKPGWLLLWGLTAGLMFTVRPFTAVCFTLPLGLIIIRKKIGLGIMLAGIGALAGSLPYFINNFYTTGSFFTAGYQAAWDGAAGLFFKGSPWGPQHTPQLGFLHLQALLQGLNTRLFEFPFPALAGIVLWILLRREKSWKEWGLFWSGFGSFAGYYFYFYVDSVYGPRFAYSAAFPWLILTALGLKSLYRYLRDRGWSTARVKWGFVSGFVLCLTMWVAVSLPARIGGYADRYCDVDKDFIATVSKMTVQNAVIFVDDYPSSDRHARLYSLGFTNRQAWYYSWRLSDEAVFGALNSLGVPPENGFGRILPLNVLGAALNRYWGNPRFIPSPQEDMSGSFIPLKQGMIYMSPDIGKNDVIYARDWGAHNRVLMEQYPGRSYFRMELKDNRYFLSKISR